MTWTCQNGLKMAQNTHFMPLQASRECKFWSHINTIESLTWAHNIYVIAINNWIILLYEINIHYYRLCYFMLMKLKWGGGGRHRIMTLELNIWQDIELLWVLPSFSSQINTFCSIIHYGHHNKWLLPWANDTGIYTITHLDHICAFYGPSKTLCGK